MSWTQRFMEKKEVGAGGAGTEWKTVGSGRSTAGLSSVTSKPALNTASEDQFPSLGKPSLGKPSLGTSSLGTPSLGAKSRPTADQARLKGFAALAASWASQDAAEATEQKRQRDDAQAEAVKRMKDTAQFGLFESIMRRGNVGEYDTADYDNGKYSPHSPIYDDDDEPEEEVRGNQMLNYNDDEEEGWATR